MKDFRICGHALPEDAALHLFYKSLNYAYKLKVMAAGAASIADMVKIPERFQTNYSNLNHRYPYQRAERGAGSRNSNTTLLKHK